MVRLSWIIPVNTKGDNRIRIRETSEDAVLLALKMKEEHMSQGMQDISKAEKGKKKKKFFP